MRRIVPAMSILVKQPRDFVPHCLSCRYELTGIADPCGRGICPECGSHFDLADLRQRSQRQSPIRSDLSASWLIYTACAASVACAPFPAPGGCRPSALADLNYLVVPFVWLTATSWLIIRRRRLFSALHSWKLVALSLPVFRTVSGIHSFDSANARYAIIGLLALLCCFTAFSLRRSRSLGPPLLLIGLFLTPPGLLMLLLPCSAPSDAWSTWPDPRFGQVHLQYPLTRSEVLTVGTTLALIGIASLLAGVILEIPRHNSALKKKAALTRRLEN